MKNPAEYPIKRIEKSSIEKFEQALDVPIIDIIRHGDTDYKQRRGFGDSFLKVDSPDFVLDSEHLDLTHGGIIMMKETADQLVKMINKDKEVVLIVSSPSDRAHSSALVLGKELKDAGVTILNTENEPRFTEALNSSEANYKKMYNKYDYTGEHGQARIKAEKKGVDFIREKRHELEARVFQQFLRHMNNIYKWLKPETLEKLKGKRLRIVCFTHAEITNNFIPEAFDFKTEGDYQQRGQILEIKPKSQLVAGKKTTTGIKLHPTRYRDSEREGQIVRGFKPKK